MLDQPNTDPTKILAIYEDHMGSDLSVVNAAKVSFGRRSTLDENGNLKPKDAKLIQFLARGMTTNDFDAVLHSVGEAWDTYTYGDPDELIAILNKWRGTPLHKSPFNHCFASFYAQAPIYTARQMVKHEYMPYNEMSGRYIEFMPHFYLPEEVRAKVEDKKQGSGKVLKPVATVLAQDTFREAHEHAYEAYRNLLREGICEEQARGVLPLNTMTQWIWSGSLGAIAKMCQLRLAPDAQKEASLLAQNIAWEMEQLYPVSWNALMNHGVG